MSAPCGTLMGVSLRYVPRTLFALPFWILSFRWGQRDVTVLTLNAMEGTGKNSAAFARPFEHFSQSCCRVCAAPVMLRD